MKKNIRKAAIAVLAVVFLVSCSLLLQDLVRAARERNTNQSLARQVREARQAIEKEQVPFTASEKEAVSISPYADSGLLRQYDPLWQQNNDLAGWLWIDGTNIDYPVMYTPEQVEYYLRRDFYKEHATSGCLFIGEGSGPDAPLVMIFGHHMRDGSMFGHLEEYQSQEYCQKHSIIHLDTLTEEREYEVIAAFRSRVYEVNEKGVFRYYRYSDLSEPEKFEEYVGQIKKAALYDTGVETSFGDRILILSTCSNYTNNGRFVVAARQKVDSAA